MLKKVVCISKRESFPEQLKVNDSYYVDTESIYNDGEDTYISVYKDSQKTKYVGVCNISHFTEV